MTTNLIERPAPAAPGTTLGAALGARETEAVGAARIVYRAAIEAESESKKLGAREIDKLAAALVTLGYGETDFNNDVRQLRELNGHRKHITRYEERCALHPAAQARIAEIDDLLPKMRTERATLAATIFREGSGLGTAQAAVNEIITAKPWLLA